MIKSVKTYNDAVVAKQDKEFKRDDLPLQLNQGKVYAVQVTPAVHHTMGGLQINTNAEVMNKEGQVIKGLYAAGEVTGGVHGGNRLGGNAMADIVTFGRIAGQNAAKAAK
ncbi:FAD-binding protein [Brevibacillus laterosporus]